MSTGGRGPDEPRRNLTTSSLASLAAFAEAHVPPAWRRPRRLILVAAVVVAIIALIIGRSTGPSHPAPGTTVFQVGDRVVLRFVHSTGSVHIRPGAGGQVSVTEHRNGITNAIHTQYQQQGDVITATVAIDNGLFTATWVDFTVAVPQDSTTTVATTAGTLTAAGLTGSFVLHDTNGSIWATHVNGAIAMRTASGSINTTQVSGQVSASTDNGTITTISTRLDGRSLLQAQNGTINFHGSLNPGCHAVFENTNGAIGVTLPSFSSVLVDARTPFGSINSQFASVHVVSSSTGRVAVGRVGRDAPAHLRLETVHGSIDLNRKT